METAETSSSSEDAFFWIIGYNLRTYHSIRYVLDQVDNLISLLGAAVDF
jgi:hypothetical protein